MGIIDVDISFSVVDETDDWILLNKPAPLIVHPTSGKVEPTLLGGVESLLSYEVTNGAKLSIVNRLDRETSGLVLIAKNKRTAREFGRAMEQREIDKEYDAICHGWPEWDERSIEAPILRKGEVTSSPIWLKQMVHPDGRDCATKFNVVSRFARNDKKFCVLRVFPKSGRMHQIRVHAAHLGFSIVGDKIYGKDETCYLEYIESGWSKKLGQDLYITRHALHSARMKIDSLELDWKVPLASDLRAFLEC